jgi:hypothetical protein
LAGGGGSASSSAISFISFVGCLRPRPQLANQWVPDRNRKLWFIGVLRDRLGKHEDLCDGILGSGLSFLAMLFVAATTTGSVTLIAAAAEPNDVTSCGAFRFARAAAFIIANAFASKMAAVSCFQRQPW